MFYKNANLYTVKCSTKNVSSFIIPKSTDNYQVLTSLLSSPNHIPQAIKQFNFSNARITDYSCHIPQRHMTLKI